jgi:hypothetical protein
VEGRVRFDDEVPDTAPQEQVVVLLEVEELQKLPPASQQCAEGHSWGNTGLLSVIYSSLS